MKHRFLHCQCDAALVNNAAVVPAAICTDDSVVVNVSYTLAGLGKTLEVTALVLSDKQRGFPNPPMIDLGFVNNDKESKGAPCHPAPNLDASSP